MLLFQVWQPGTGSLGASCHPSCATGRQQMVLYQMLHPGTGSCGPNCHPNAAQVEPAAVPRNAQAASIAFIKS